MEQLDPQTLVAIVETFTRGLAATEVVDPQLARSTSLLAATLLARTDAIRAMLVDLQALGAFSRISGPDVLGNTVTMLPQLLTWGYLSATL